MKQNPLAQAISDINKGDGSLPVLEPSLPAIPSEIDEVFASNPSHWEELDTLYTELGTNLLSLATSIGEMVHREDIVNNLGNDRKAFLDLAVRSLKDCEHVSEQLAATKQLHEDKKGIVSDAEQYTDYVKVYTYYETIMTNNLSMINLSAIDLVNMAQKATEETKNATGTAEDSTSSESQNNNLNVAIEINDSENLTLDTEGAKND